MRIVVVSTNGEEISSGIWRISTECIMELGGKFILPIPLIVHSVKHAMKRLHDTE